MASSNSMNMDEAGVQTYSTTTGNLTGSTTTQYNVIVGDANNKLANVAPSATSGVPLISSGSSVNPAFGTAVVAGGGTGNTTFTAYSVICAGTTATGAFQNVSGLGNSGQALTSNGASALPTWQAAPSGSKSFVFTINTTDSGAGLSGISLFLADGAPTNFYSTESVVNRYYIPLDGTITRVYGVASCTPGSGENNTLAIRLNNTTDTNVSTTYKLNTSPSAFNNTGLSISVSAGDFINFKLVGGMVTPANSVDFAVTIYVSVP